jgi:hypothetical protein
MYRNTEIHRGRIKLHLLYVDCRTAGNADAYAKQKVGREQDCLPFS